METSGSTITVSLLTIFLLAISTLQITCLISLLHQGLATAENHQLRNFRKHNYWLIWFTGVLTFIAGISFPVHQLSQHTFSEYDNDNNIQYLNMMVLLAITSFILSIVRISALYLVTLIKSSGTINYSISLFKLLITSLVVVLTIQIMSFITAIYLNDKVRYNYIHELEFGYMKNVVFDLYLTFGISNGAYNMLFWFLSGGKLHNTGSIFIYALCLICFLTSAFSISLYGYICTDVSANAYITQQMYLIMNYLDVCINCLSLSLQFKYAKKLVNDDV